MFIIHLSTINRECVYTYVQKKMFPSEAITMFIYCNDCMIKKGGVCTSAEEAM